MGHFLGALKPSIMNCNCICTVFFSPLIASAYIQYTYITKFSVKLSYARDFPHPKPPPDKEPSFVIFEGGLLEDGRK